MVVVSLSLTCIWLAQIIINAMSITARGEHKFCLVLLSAFPSRLSLREYGALFLAVSLLLDGVGIGEAYKPEFPNPIIMTQKGKVKGISYMANNHKVDAFLGIPYAQPPVGELRFKQPLQKDSWKPLVWDATKLPNSCWQNLDFVFDNFTGSTMWNANTEMSEDCLYLNVWIPRVKPAYRKKPVIVWIYGGGFYSGSSTLPIYMPEYLASENDVIVVSMQYRVGALGFLALDGNEVPGNAGLFDQRMALEWVSTNIEDFGGDRESVTLMGESAGAVSVGLFLLCPICVELYHRAILQSGSPTAEWGVVSKVEGRARSRYIAQLLSCSGNDNELVRCLRSKNASEFVEQELYVTQGICQFPFAPIIDGVFIREEPREMLRRGNFKKVPLLLGSNSNEGSFFIIYFLERSFAFNKTISLSPSQYHVRMNDFFRYYPYYSLSYQRSASPISIDAIMFQYRNWVRKNDAEELMKSIDKAVSDYFFVCKVNELAVRYTEWNTPVYYYWFDQRWSANPWPEWMGVLHADEIWFTFGHPLNRSHSFTEGEKMLSRKMMTYWTNFAKSGDPNKEDKDDKSMQEWPTFGKEQRYKMLSVESMRSNRTVGEYPRTERCAFWDEYLPKLEAQTSDINEIERQWKEEFHLWKNRYIVDWKTQFDSFIRSYQERMGSCGGGRP